MARLIIFSGAGISAESGIPTFRDDDGLWEGHSIDVVCNFKTWLRNYNSVHRFYDDRRTILADVEPNTAHKMVAEWSDRYEVINMTQNVDDLFERAGCREVTHLHGRITDMRCMECDYVWDVGYGRHTDTRCPDGHEKQMKPAVVFFHEHAPRYFDLQITLANLEEDDVILVIGTSDSVVRFSDFLDRKPGRKFWVNPARSYSRVYEREFNMPASEAMPLLDQIIRDHFGG